GGSQRPAKSRVLFSRAAASEGRKLVHELRAFAAGGCGPPVFDRSFSCQLLYRAAVLRRRWLPVCVVLRAEGQ
ncbi:hypothetical protein, partial [uncultured Alistipes sp.]|uniref:hypothetical protein n=1 Tax=uncultured Alistipes sp. TaxID=538949 RepID=UPI00261AF751